MEEPKLSDTLEYAKEYAREKAVEGGAKCPCCDQLVKVYKRKFNSGMALVLLHIYQIDKTKADPEKWIKITSEVLARGINPTNLEYAKLKYWGFIESRGDAGEATKSAGFWRITDKGRRFVEGLCSVPKYVYIYDNQLLKTSDAQTNIRESLGNKFNYDELMGY